jgi:hypothetical protein
MKLSAAHQSPGDVGRLQQSALGRKVGVRSAGRLALYRACPAKAAVVI